MGGKGGGEGGGDEKEAVNEGIRGRRGREGESQSIEFCQLESSCFSL